jgi:hypothetical protein
VADAIHQAAKVDKHCSGGIADTGYRMDEQEELRDY